MKVIKTFVIALLLVSLMICQTPTAYAYEPHDDTVSNTDTTIVFMADSKMSYEQKQNVIAKLTSTNNVVLLLQKLTG